MTVLAAIAEWSVLAFGLLLLGIQVLVQEIGFWFGRRHRARAEGQSEAVGIVVGGMLGLLAFVLALTLSFANTRFSERRAGALAEANAIGTAWLRAEAIGHPRGTEIARLLEEYTKLRMEFIQASRNPALIDELNQRNNALQSMIWGHLTAIVREQPNTVSTSLMAALNDTFDMTTAERFAYDLRLPPQIFWLLIGMTLLGMTALGYQLGLRGRPVRTLIVLLTVMWTLVIVDILDLSSARLGKFRTSTAVYEWTLQGFRGGISVPPLKP
jgi:hypothetical protein